MAQNDLYHYWTYWATIETAENKGRAEGKAEGRTEGRAESEIHKTIEIARNMKQKGFDTAIITELTRLSADEIKRLK